MTAIVIEVPHAADIDEGFIPQNVNMRLSPHQGRALKRLAISLRRDNAELSNGRPVFDGAGAVRWLLEQYGRTT